MHLLNVRYDVMIGVILSARFFCRTLVDRHSVRDSSIPDDAMIIDRNARTYPSMKTWEMSR